MKRLFITIMMLAALFCLCASAETTVVTTGEGFFAALEDDSCTLIDIVSDISISGEHIVLNKDVLVEEGACLTFTAAEGNEFWVKTLTIPQDVTLTVRGSLAAVSLETKNMYYLANIFIDGGTLDITEGAAVSPLPIAFNHGSLLVPEGGLEGARVSRYIYGLTGSSAYTAELKEAAGIELLDEICLQDSFTLLESVALPENTRLLLDGCMLRIPSGMTLTAANLTGTADGSGLMLEGTGSCGISVQRPQGSLCTLLLWSGKLEVFLENYIWSLGENLSWKLIGDTLTIAGEGAIPDLGDAAPWAEYEDDIRVVVIEEGITGLGRRLLADTMAEELYLPSGITSIDDEAFVIVPGGFTAFIPMGGLDSYLGETLLGLRIDITMTEGETETTVRFDDDGGRRDETREDGGLVSYVVYNADGYITELFTGGVTERRDPQNHAIERVNEKGERIYFMMEFPGGAYMEFDYFNWTYPDDTHFSVDFDGFMTGTGHMTGTDYFVRVDGVDVEVKSIHIMDDGTRTKDLYDFSGAYTTMTYDAEGNPVMCERYSENYEQLSCWDLSRGIAFTLPAGLEEIGGGAFTGISAGVIRIPEGVKRIAEGAFDEGTLLVVSEGQPITARIAELGYIYFELMK